MAAVIKQLFDSLADLERSITLAKGAVKHLSPAGESFLERLSYYEEVLEKQKRLAATLRQQVEAENWEEVFRLVKLINGFSVLVHEDAKSLVQELTSGQDGVNEDAYSA